MEEKNVPVDYSGLDLLPHHLKLIEASAISPDVARARGYRSVTTGATLRKLGFSDRQARAPALLVPVWGVHGDIVLYQARPDDPRIVDGKALKYETPAGARMALDVPPHARSGLRDPTRPLFITEGARKADAAVSKGLLSVALLGVWNWRGSNEARGKAALPDWETIALNGRKVYIAFDSDVSEKPEVHAALSRLKSFLESRGAEVRVIYLPPGEGGKKVGLDDYFAQGATVAELLSLAESDLRQSGKETNGPYEARGGGLFWLKPVEDGAVSVPLTNFTAEIKSDVLLDNGAESRREFEIEAALKGRVSLFTVPAAQFPSMSWATSHLGAEAILYPGQMVRDHARCAVQMLSEKIQKRTVFTHTGWRKLGEDWVYLHAGGALGKDGAVDGLEVFLPSLSRHELLDPPTGGELKAVAREALKLLELAPERITVPLLGSVYRAVLGSCDFSVHLSGPSGTGKTELAALAQQHFGPDMNARSLPGSWSSTANALEALAFDAKDALLVIDDFAPCGGLLDTQRAHREADRLLRAQGNSSGRQRMRSDGSLRDPRPPRGLILSTGEDIPRGKSLRARIVTVEVEPRALNWEKLTGCQRAGKDGVYARCLSAFVAWLSERYEEARSWTREVMDRVEGAGWKGSLKVDPHKRSLGNLAQLLLGFEVFLDFLEEKKALDEVSAALLRGRAREVLRTLALYQHLDQEAEDPVVRHLALLSAGLLSGRGHVASLDGSPPEDGESWGWRRLSSPGELPRWEGRGDLVGWIEDGSGKAPGERSLYLEPEASFALVQRVGRETGEPLALGSRTVQKRLSERGLLVSAEEGHSTVRAMIQGRRRRVLHLRAGVLETPTLEYVSNRSNRSRGLEEPSGERSYDKGSWTDPLDPTQNLSNGSSGSGHETDPLDRSKGPSSGSGHKTEVASSSPSSTCGDGGPIGPKGQMLYGRGQPEGREGKDEGQAQAQDGDTFEVIL